jgi:hypothetical protein
MPEDLARAANSYGFNGFKKWRRVQTWREVWADGDREEKAMKGQKKGLPLGSDSPGGSGVLG